MSPRETNERRKHGEMRAAVKTRCQPNEGSFFTSDEIGRTRLCDENARQWMRKTSHMIIHTQVHTFQMTK